MIWNYPYAYVLRVHDGDTVIADVDLGFHTWVRKIKFRLARINAPELHEPGGKEAKHFLEELLSRAGNVVPVKVIREDKYANRWVADLLTPAGSASDLLFEAGLAKVYDDK